MSSTTSNAVRDHFNAFVAKNRTQPANIGFVAGLCNAIKTVVGEVVGQLRTAIREQRDETSARFARQDGLNILTDARLASLEATTNTRGVSGVCWGGVFEPGHEYHEGELVTKNGLWLATKTTRTAPGSDPTSWKLIVHRRLVPTDHPS